MAYTREPDACSRRRIARGRSRAYLHGAMDPGRSAISRSASANLSDFRALPLALLCVFTLLAVGCGKSQPYGQQDSIIVIMPDSVWAEVEDTTYAAIERPVETVRRQSKYHVTQVDPGTPQLSQLKLWYQVVVVGPPSDELVQQVLDAAGTDRVTPPEMVSAGSIWSRGQVVRAVVVPPDRMAEAWTAHLDDLYADIEGTYRRFVEERMWTSGRDTALADTLADRYGFSLIVPKVYEVIEGDRLVIFRNDNPRPADLIRSISVSWRSPAPDSLTPELAYEWRGGIDSLHYGTAQGITPDTSAPRRFLHDGHEALEVTGNWSDEGPYPAGGPFTLWLVRCGDRVYLLDSWIYAPDPERGKYQYLLQLEWIRDTFRCGEGAPG